MPAKKWTACERGKCRAHKAVCFHCKRVADSFCGRHASSEKIKVIGGRSYCVRPPVCQRALTERKRIMKTRSTVGWGPVGREYPQECFRYAACTRCGKQAGARGCAGPTYGPSRYPTTPCPETKVTELCVKCASWTRGFDGYARCPSCHANYISKNTCKNCGVPSSKEKKFSCSKCDKLFCDKCDVKTTVDVSPPTLYGFGYDIYLCENFCKACMSETTPEEVQNEYKKTDRFNPDNEATMENSETEDSETKE